MTKIEIAKAKIESLELVIDTVEGYRDEFVNADYYEPDFAEAKVQAYNEIIAHLEKLIKM